MSTDEETENQRRQKFAEEEIAIKNSCDHIKEFLETLEDFDEEALTRETRDKLHETRRLMLTKFGNPEVNAQAIAGGATASRYVKEERDQMTNQNQSIMEVIADKLDNRKVPDLRKFSEERGESLMSFFERFEDYCRKNVKDESGEHWIDLLESYFKGETLEVYKCYRDTCKDYANLRDKMLSWHTDMKDSRMKKAISKFEKAKIQDGESLLLFSSKLEKWFTQAYPGGNIERSLILRRTFEKALPKKDGKSFQSYKFKKKLEDEPLTWEIIKKWCRIRDTFRKENSDDDGTGDDDNDVKEISINVTEKKPKERKQEVKVQYDHDKKLFYLVNPESYGIETPSVCMTTNHQGSNQAYRQNTTDNYHQGNYHSNSQSRQFPRNNFRGSNQQRPFGPRPNFQQNQFRSQNNNNVRMRNSNDFNGHRMSYSNSDTRPRHRFPAVPTQRVIRCYSCNRVGHIAKECTATQRYCFVCGKAGHISMNCRERKDPISDGSHSNGNNKPGSPSN